MRERESEKEKKEREKERQVDKQTNKQDWGAQTKIPYPLPNELILNLPPPTFFSPGQVVQES